MTEPLQKPRHVARRTTRPGRGVVGSAAAYSLAIPADRSLIPVPSSFSKQLRRRRWERQAPTARRLVLKGSQLLMVFARCVLAVGLILAALSGSTARAQEADEFAAAEVQMEYVEAAPEEFSAPVEAPAPVGSPSQPWFRPRCRARHPTRPQPRPQSRPQSPRQRRLVKSRPSSSTTASSPWR